MYKYPDKLKQINTSEWPEDKKGLLKLEIEMVNMITCEYLSNSLASAAYYSGKESLEAAYTVHAEGFSEAANKLETK